jgi:hypothetical protein
MQESDFFHEMAFVRMKSENMPAYPVFFDTGPNMSNLSDCCISILERESKTTLEGCNSGICGHGLRGFTPVDNHLCSRADCCNNGFDEGFSRTR